MNAQKKKEKKRWCETVRRLGLDGAENGGELGETF